MPSKIIVIGAVSQDGVYGVGNDIPWKIKSEMQHFKAQTSGHTVIMGRGTWESLPPKFRPLPNRVNMVITNTPDYVAEGASVFRSIEQAVQAASSEKVFCIGGHDIWYHAMSLADEAFITLVKQDFRQGRSDERLAQELVHPQIKWPHLKLHQSISYGDPEEIRYEINHWSK